MTWPKLIAIVLVAIVMIRLGFYGYVVPSTHPTLLEEWRAALKDPVSQSMFLLLVVMLLLVIN